MKLNISNVLIFAFLCSLSLAPTASAQFGMDKLLGGDKEEEETAEQADSPSSALGGLFGGGKEEEPEFVLADAATWLAKSKEEQVQYISEVRELYPEDPPIGSPEAAALAEEREEKEGGLGFLKKAGAVLGGGLVTSGPSGLANEETCMQLLRVASRRPQSAQAPTTPAAPADASRQMIRRHSMTASSLNRSNTGLGVSYSMNVGSAQVTTRMFSGSSMA